jgi:GMP synthase-like glutamine amidotransferase
MRIHVIDHDPIDFSRTNITMWAEKKGYGYAKTDVFRIEPLPSLDEFEWLVVMGGSQHVWDEAVNPWLPKEKAFIADAVASDKIVLGICFGAQLLAEILGGRVFPNDHEEIGWFKVSLTPPGKKSFLFRGIPETFLTFHWHSDRFALPPGCTRLAFTEPTPNQAFVCGNRPVVALQFHPEFTLDLVKRFAIDYSQEWVSGPYVSGKAAVLAETKGMPDTYWLMERILDNMERKFGETTDAA